MRSLLPKRKKYYYLKFKAKVPIIILQALFGFFLFFIILLLWVFLLNLEIGNWLIVQSSTSFNEPSYMLVCGCMRFYRRAGLILRLIPFPRASESELLINAAKASF